MPRWTIGACLPACLPTAPVAVRTCWAGTGAVHYLRFTGCGATAPPPAACRCLPAAFAVRCCHHGAGRRDACLPAEDHLCCHFTWNCRTLPLDGALLCCLPATTTVMHDAYLLRCLPFRVAGLPCLPTCHSTGRRTGADRYNFVRQLLFTFCRPLPGPPPPAGPFTTYSRTPGRVYHTVQCWYIFYLFPYIPGTSFTIFCSFVQICCSYKVLLLLRTLRCYRVLRYSGAGCWYSRGRTVMVQAIFLYIFCRFVVHLLYIFTMVHVTARSRRYLYTCYDSLFVHYRTRCHRYVVLPPVTLPVAFYRWRYSILRYHD